MLFNYPTFLTAACLLAVTAVAFPVEAPGDLAAPDALGVLDVRQDQTACPTTSRWERVEYITKYLATYTPTVEVIYGRNITSTATSTYHGSVTRWTTVYSPAVTTIPTSTYSSVVATETSEMTWAFWSTTVTVDEHAPSELCQWTTFTNIIPGTSTTTLTYKTSFAPDTTIHTTTYTTTVTEYDLTTIWTTTTVPGATAYATTITQNVTTTDWTLHVATGTSTVYAKGCKTWACAV
ncbi:hypothetical protein VTJ04DRAFT_5033 [Mycothermus thermophilus]|uniref:uncharacterized protein n=1 Tax=Humicola insolens TaxID=85995 RepID=UPI003742ED1A